MCILLNQPKDNLYCKPNLLSYTLNSKLCFVNCIAWMVELVDTLDSKSGFSNGVRVRVPLQAPYCSQEIIII